MPDTRDLPPPMTPPDCDLRGFDWMPLFGHRLFGSDLYASATDEEFRAAIRMWWGAWQQCPAASLPNNERALAEAAGYGRDLAGWHRVRDVALRGFTLCSDGRLHHPLLAEAALKAHERRRADRERKRTARARQQEKQGAAERGAEGGTPDVSVRVPSAGQDADCPQPVRAERESERERNTPSLREGGAASAPPDRLPDARDMLWADGLGILRALTGKPNGPARALLGQMCRDAGDDCAVVLAVLHDAQRDRPGNPVPWIKNGIATRTGRRVGTGPPSRLSYLTDAPPPSAPPATIDMTPEGDFR
jgi:hypothetical protein